MTLKFNDDNFSKKMRNITATWENEGSNKALKETMNKAYDRSQDLVKVKTGKLKSSGKVTIDKKNHIGALTYDEFYAQFIEFRVKPYLRPAMNPAKVRSDIKKSTSKELKKTIKSKT